MSSGLNRLLLFGGVTMGITLVSVFGYFAYTFYRKKAISAPVKKPARSNIVKEEEEEDDNEEEEEEHEEESHDEVQKEEKVLVVEKNGNIDVDTEDTYKAKYDDTIRLAKKLLSGNAYIRAAEKFKEAIKLAEHVPTASKDLITLYNNSSAMYEKAGVYDEALLDINIVLHMDNKHTKARLRRARIFDIQGKQLAALNDYVMVMLIEQSKGENTGAAHAGAVDKLAKTLAAKETSKYMNKMRENKIVLGPATKGYSKQFFESFPSYYVWGSKYASSDRESLPANLLSLEEDDVLSVEDRLKFTLDLICFDIYHRRFSKAHELLTSEKMLDIVAEAEEKLKATITNNKDETASSSSSAPTINTIFTPDTLEKQLSVYHDLLGSYHQLSCRFGDAETEYDRALALWKDNIDARLKSIMLFIEYGETYTAESLYTDWLQQVVASEPPPLIPLDILKTSSSSTTPDVDVDIAAEESVKENGNETTTAGVVTDVIENILSTVTGATSETKETATNGITKAVTPSSSDSTASTPAVSPIKAITTVVSPVKTSTTVPSVSSPVKSWQTDVGVSTPLPAESAVLEAWIITHRAGLWTCRDSSGTYMPEAVNLAISDISRVRNITDKYENEPNPQFREALKGARYVAALKAQYVVSHTAGQMGVVVTPSQTEFVKICTDIAAELFPESDNVQLQEIETLLNEGDLEKALNLVEKGSAEVKARGDTSLECTYLLMTANIVTQQAFGMLNDYSGNAASFQSTMQEAVELYERAVAVEPTSSEAIAPYAQLKCFMGDFKNAVGMVEGALKLVRTRDETQDLYQLFFMTRAQAQVVDELK